MSQDLPPSNTLLAFGSTQEVRAETRRLIELLGRDGGYIVDSSAIMQNDTTVENLRALSLAAREFGLYRSESSPSPAPVLPVVAAGTAGLPEWAMVGNPRPGVCFPFEEKLKELPEICGDAALVKRVWEEHEGLAYLFIWHLVLSF